MAWTKSKPMLKHERELWRDAVLDAADGDEDIKHISRRLQIALDAKRGRATGLGELGALELLAALGVYLNDNDGQNDAERDGGR